MALPLAYHWRNLFVRKSGTLLTFGVVTAIVFVLTWALAFGEGMRQTLRAGGADDKLIVIKPGATGESTSVITLEEFNLLTQLPGLAVREDGVVLRSGETCPQAGLPRKDGPADQLTPVAVRGVDEVGFDVHSTVRIVEGRRFRPGSDEIIVGRAISRRVAGLNIGDELTLGYRGTSRYRIVGVFEAGGGPLESEIWGSLASIQEAFGRDMLSSVALRVADAREAEAIARRIKEAPYLLNAKTERRYYQDITDKSTQLVGLTLMLVAIMAFGACFAVANTSYSAVDARTREIAMLRTIGYSRRAIVAAFVLESLLVCGAASVLGAGAASMFHGKEQDFMAEATWSTFAYKIEVTPEILAVSLGAAVAVGVIGAAAPAMRAARVKILTALRQA